MAMSNKELSNNKSAEAFRTIREVAEVIDVPQHVLRFWESKFKQVRKDSGGTTGGAAVEEKFNIVI